MCVWNVLAISGIPQWITTELHCYCGFMGGLTWSSAQGWWLKAMHISCLTGSNATENCFSCCTLWHLSMERISESSQQGTYRSLPGEPFSDYFLQNPFLPEGDTVTVNFRILTMKLSPNYKSNISHYFFPFPSLLWILLGDTVKNGAHLFTSEVKFCLEWRKNKLKLSTVVRKC